MAPSKPGQAQLLKQEPAHEGMKAAFLDSSWDAGTLLGEADGSHNRPGPRKGPLVALNISRKTTAEEFETKWLMEKKRLT